MQIFDIILMALVVVFLVLRLRGALGSRDGFDGKDQDEGFTRDPSERQQNSDDDNVIAMPGARISAPAGDPSFTQDEPKQDDDLKFEGALADGVAAIRKADPEFRAKDFLEGANFAFEMILNAYAANDIKTLKPLLSADVFGGFAGAIEDRETRGQTLQETLVGIGQAELVEAYMDNRDAHVTVKFVSEQISALLDSEGSVIEGDPAKVINATDYWTFARSTKSSNPNWTLVGTGSLS